MAILSLSREFQSGGQEIGQAVAQELRYDFVDKDRILKDMKEAGDQWGYLVQDLDEVRPTVWERYDRQYRSFIALVESIIYDYALKDRVVILGRGSTFLLQDIPHVLKVRICAPLKKRIERALIKFDVDQETAASLIEKTDRSRAGYIQSIYGKQWDDKRYFDLTFDTGLQSIEEVTQVIAKALQEWDRRATPEGHQKLRNLALAARVKAHIFIKIKLSLPTLEIFHDGQAIVLRGVVHSPKESHLVQKLAATIAGPHPIRNELHYRT
jgi:cytidylate kinase